MKEVVVERVQNPKYQVVEIWNHVVKEDGEEEEKEEEEEEEEEEKEEE